eukprot:TRINITY_DN1058_c0_g1_i1.p1 TRINITY_DN1058_c0_g1~~TRINITY_DN1058_c0_g1_i1.p1  ORF type:complete len:186 (-),score=35.98 TRINITY_DN1058_c0_g1_i1:177-713(-)
MLPLVILISVLFASVCAEEGARLEGRLLVSREALRKGARAIVNGGERVVYVATDGNFVIPNLPPGSHILDFSVPDFIFPQVRLDVSKKNPAKVRATRNDERRGEPLPYPLILEPKAKANYFAVREVYDVTAMLKQPMVIMMLIGAVMVFLMPRLADQDEMKQQMQEVQGMFSKLQPKA